MAGLRSHERTNHGELVAHLSEVGEQLADFQARGVCWDWAEFPAELGRSQRFEIEHVLVRRTTTQVNVDDRFVRGANTGGRLGSQQIGHCEATETRSSDLEEAPSIHTVTVAMGFSEDRQHGLLLKNWLGVRVGSVPRWGGRRAKYTSTDTYAKPEQDSFLTSSAISVCSRIFRK